MGKYKKFLGLGIAGNFALHLDQAGEAEDFQNIITKDETAPKGMFPFYLPLSLNNTSNAQLCANKLLTTYPLSPEYIQMPKDKAHKIQAEPEVALICDMEYRVGKISKIIPKYFTAYNDCSIRIKGAKKISEKKNWGHNTKGISETLLPIDRFSEGGVMDDYSICSFLKRDDKIKQYGENAKLIGYSYFHEKLTHWMEEQIETQNDEGPLEPLSEYIIACEYPKEAIISIGATRYTPYGENTFLQIGDEIIVIVYNHTKFSFEDITSMVHNHKYSQTDMSVLSQKVIHHE